MSAGPKRVAQYSISGDHAHVADVARARSAGATIAAEDLGTFARLGLDGGELPRRGEFLGRVLCNRYLVEDVLLEGAAGLTCRAYHLALDRPVLLRVTPIAPDPSGESWLSEVPCALRSRYLLNTIEVGRLKEGWSFFVTDHPRGSVLTPLEVELERLSISGIVALGRQIAMALDAAHRAGVTHGALKLDDVFIADARTPTEHLSLVGFGVLRAAILSLPPVASGIFRLDGEGPSPPVQPCLPEASDDVHALGMILGALVQVVSRRVDISAARRNTARPAAQNAVLSGLTLIVETCLAPTARVGAPSAWEVACDLARLEVVSRSMLPDVPSEPPPAPAVEAPGEARPSVIVHRPHPKQQVDKTRTKVIVREPPEK
jgi:hypothetical protein